MHDSIYTKQKSRARNVMLHIIGCIGFVTLPFLFFPHPDALLDSLDNEPTIRDFIGQFLLIGFFYVNYYFFIPRYYHHHRYARYTVVLLLCFIAILMLPSVITGRFNHTPNRSFSGPPFLRDSFHHGPPHSTEKFSSGENRDDLPPLPPGGGNDLSFLIEVSHTVFLFLIVLFFSLMLSSNNRLKQTQREKTDAELSYLKAQINPHFLFNTLNSIYSLTLQKSDAASDAVVKLAGMMRYVLHEADKETVPLSKEVDYIRDYIALQQLRFGTQVPVKCMVEGEENSDKRIAPLILISFIENAFKHGVNAEEDSDIFIQISITHAMLRLLVRNNKVTIRETEHSGIGLQNVKDRLQYLYPQHVLRITETDTLFEVQLTIPLL